MKEQNNRQSTWRLVRVDELLMPSPGEVEQARHRWEGRLVWFALGAGRW